MQLFCVSLPAWACRVIRARPTMYQNFFVLQIQHKMYYISQHWGMPKMRLGTATWHNDASLGWKESLAAARSLDRTVVVQFCHSVCPYHNMSHCWLDLQASTHNSFPFTLSLHHSHLQHRVTEADVRAKRLRLLTSLQRSAHHGRAHPELDQ